MHFLHRYRLRLHEVLFPLERLFNSRIKHYKTVFSTTEGNIDRQVLVFVPGNNLGIMLIAYFPSARRVF